MEEKTLSMETVYEGRVLGLDLLQIEMANGVQSMREVVRHRGAVAVLGQQADGRYVFVRQYRKAVEQEVIEIVAGLLEEGETPEACARREMEEETGFRVSSVKPAGVIYPSPGYTEERIHLFCAEVEAGGVPSPDDDERVVVVCLDRGEVIRHISNGQICDAKTLAAWLLCGHSLADSEVTEAK